MAALQNVPVHPSRGMVEPHAQPGRLHARLLATGRRAGGAGGIAGAGTGPSAAQTTASQQAAPPEQAAEERPSARQIAHDARSRETQHQGGIDAPAQQQKNSERSAGQRAGNPDSFGQRLRVGADESPGAEPEQKNSNNTES